MINDTYLKKRILTLSDSPKNGEAVLYVMSRDQRVKDNHALIVAQEDALARKVPLVVLFNLYASTGHRSREQYQFMIDGLNSVKKDLAKVSIEFIIRTGDPTDSTLSLANELLAAAIYFDFSPLRGPRKLAKAVASKFDGSCFVVDTHNIIPVWVASDSQEFAAHTIRRKVHKHLENYLVNPGDIKNHPYSISTLPKSASPSEIKALINRVGSSGIKAAVPSGETAANLHLKDFIKSSLSDYAIIRNDPTKDGLSGVSPYLHFGQLSSLRVALEVTKAVDEPPLLLREPRMAQAGDSPSKSDGMNALLEEMIVRKELSDNFCFYNSSYDSIQGAADWAKKTLREHEGDEREFIYTKKQWEDAKTHDAAWNASQTQLARTGKLHGYMRMYWAKKLLEWSKSPGEAIKIGIYLNDKYSIDGGDPNGYVGILWSIAGLHDRPWTERNVFGKIRYMNYGGLKRKFDIEAYIRENS